MAPSLLGQAGDTIEAAMCLRTPRGSSQMSKSLLARCLPFTLTITLIPAAAAADSDGYFCSAPGLVAFDNFISAGEPGRLIKIVRFDAAGGIYPEEEVKISEDFQTHGMVCRPGTVEVYSRDHVYVLDTSVPPATKLREKRPSVYGRTAPVQRNLGNFARRAEVIVLESSGDGNRFELVIARGGFFVKGEGGRTYTSTDLVHLVDGQMKEHRRLFFGVRKETVD